VITFNTWWKPAGVSYIAARLASLAETLGHEACIVSRRFHLKNVEPAWDARVVQEDDSKAKEALINARVVVWPEMLWEDHAILAKAYGARTYLIPMWESITQANKRTLSYYTSILAPSACIAEAFRKQGFSRVQHLPYDPGVPATTHKPFNQDKIHFFFPLAAMQARRRNAETLKIMGRLMQRYPNLHLTASTLQQKSNITEDLLRLSLAFKERVTVHTNLSHAKHLAQYSQHDLTLWPTEQEGLGIIGSESIQSGTPVLALDIPPLNEYLTKDKDAILLPCEVKQNWFGVPTGKFNPESFESALQGLIEQPRKLQELLQTTTGLPTKISEAFKLGWTRIFENSVITQSATRPTN